MTIYISHIYISLQSYVVAYSKIHLILLSSFIEKIIACHVIFSLAPDFEGNVELPGVKDRTPRSQTLVSHVQN